MTFARKYFAQLLVLAAAGVLLVGLGLAQANEETSLLVKKPDTPTTEVPAGPALPPPSNPKPQAEAGAPVDVTPPALLPKPETLPTPPQTSQSTGTTKKRPFMRPAVPRGPARGKLVDQESSRIVGAPPQPTPPQPTPPQPTPPQPTPPQQIPPQQIPPQEALPPSPGASPNDMKLLPAPPIEYDTDHDARKMYRKSGSVDVVMATQDPADGCCYAIPLCIPACCVGEPSVSSGHSLLGRGVVEYCWPCGFRAIVKFRHALGDVRVDYEGD